MLEIEAKLWKMLESLRTEMEVAVDCKEWWTLTDSEWVLTIDVSFYFFSHSLPKDVPFSNLNRKYSEIN